MGFQARAAAAAKRTAAHAQFNTGGYVERRTHEAAEIGRRGRIYTISRETLVDDGLGGQVSAGTVDLAVAGIELEIDAGKLANTWIRESVIRIKFAGLTTNGAVLELAQDDIIELPGGRKVRVLDTGPHRPDGITAIYYMAHVGDRENP